MIIEIEIPEGNPPLAWYLVKHILQGAALGCRPFFVGPHALPPLKSTNVKFAYDTQHGSGRERFRLPLESLQLGTVDCDGATLYEVARRMANRYGLANLDPPGDNVTIADLEKNGDMHAQIRRENGTIQDLSIELGAATNWPRDFLYDLKKGRR